MPAKSTKRTKRVLEPVERLSEFLFGLITVLTFTTALDVTAIDRGDIHKMLLAALGCSLAWGIIDGFFYLLDCFGRRGRSIFLLRELQRTANSRVAELLIGDELPPLVASVLTPSEYESLRQRLIESAESTDQPRLARQDWTGALGVFLLVFLSMFPIVVPFIVVPNPWLALRISNGIAIVLLFSAGYSFGRLTNSHPWRSGLLMLVLGVVVVFVAILLGG